MMQEKVETIPVMDTLQLEKNKKTKSKAFWGWLVLLIVVIVEICFCVMWHQQQKIADRHMERLLETATLRNAEELTEAEIAFLYENYVNTTQMASFKKERERIFLDRVSGVSGLTIKEVSLTRCQTEDASFLQLCFVCEFEDKVSDSLLYAYRYYESGMQEKYICYAYDTIKSKLFWEVGTGMTVRYNSKGKSLVVEGMSYYDDALCGILDKVAQEY